MAIGGQFGTPTTPGILISSEVRSGRPTSGTPTTLICGLGGWGRTVTPPDNSIQDIESEADFRRLVTIGSQLWRMYRVYRQNDPTTRVALGFLAPPASSSGDAPTSITATIAGTATSDGTFLFRFFGRDFSLPVATGDIAAHVGTRLLATINQHKTLGVSAVAPLTATAVQLRPRNYEATARFPLGFLTGHEKSFVSLDTTAAGVAAQPAGMTVTLTLSDGRLPTQYSAAPLIAAMGDRRFDAIVLPPARDADLALFQAELSSTMTGRWGYDRQLYGHIFTARSADNFSAVARNAENDAHTSMLMYPKARLLTPDDEVAAAFAGAAMTSLTRDPAAPPAGIGGLPLEGIRLLPGEMFTRQEQEITLNWGWATLKLRDDNRPAVVRVISTYTRNSDGDTDTSWRDVTTPFSIAEINRTLVRALSMFSGYKLARDGTRIGAQQRVVTPETVKLYVVAAYRGLEDRGIVQDSDGFSADIVARISPDAPGQLNLECPIRLISGLYVITLTNRFAYSAGSGAAGTAEQGGTDG